jgi:hypothetical protein
LSSTPILTAVNLARDMLGVKFADGFPNVICTSSSAEIVPGRVLLSTPAGSPIVVPLTGVLVQIDESNGNGAYAVLQRGVSPLQNQFVRIGPLLVATGLSDLLNTTLPLGTVLGSIDASAATCELTQDQVREREWAPL